MGNCRPIKVFNKVGEFFRNASKHFTAKFPIDLLDNVC